MIAGGILLSPLPSAQDENLPPFLIKTSRPDAILHPNDVASSSIPKENAFNEKIMILSKDFGCDATFTTSWHPFAGV